jgi:tetraacyldisaccharide 4'-kinase
VFSHCKAKVKRVVSFSGPEVSLQGCKVGIFCGIGHPERFKKTVESLGAEIVCAHILADHEPADPRTLASLFNSFSIKYLVCTEKDAVKLSPTDLPIVVVEIEADPAEDLDLWQNMVAKIAQKLNN